MNGNNHPTPRPRSADALRLATGRRRGVGNAENRRRKLWKFAEVFYCLACSLLPPPSLYTAYGIIPGNTIPRPAERSGGERRREMKVAGQVLRLVPAGRGGKSSRVLPTGTSRETCPATFISLLLSPPDLSAGRGIVLPGIMPYAVYNDGGGSNEQAKQ